ncbi:MAG: hypothetical protein AAF170_05850 [Bacteroidota bacterium]
MRFLLLVLALGLAVPAQAQSTPPQPAALASARHMLDAGVATNNPDSLLAARAQLAVLANADDASGHWATYYAALADYRLAYLFWSRDADRAGQHAASGASALEALRQEGSLPDPLPEESAALLSALYSTQMGLDASLGMTLGQKASMVTREASRLAPANPRVQYVQAMSLASTPAEWGGDPEQALELFRSSVEAFEAETPSGMAPRWGEDEAYAWLGMTLLQRGELAEAREAIEASEAINPTSEFVQYKLKPWLASVEADAQ